MHKACAGLLSLPLSLHSYFRVSPLFTPLLTGTADWDHVHNLFIIVIMNIYCIAIFLLSDFDHKPVSPLGVDVCLSLVGDVPYPPLLPVLPSSRVPFCIASAIIGGKNGPQSALEDTSWGLKVPYRDCFLGGSSTYNTFRTWWEFWKAETIANPQFSAGLQ
jgi:hypothetical protein